MTKVTRALQELQHTCQRRGGNLQILYVSGSVLDRQVNGHNIPMKWRCTINPRNELWTGYGCTMDDAILECHYHWQNQIGSVEKHRLGIYP